jgi:hypothetical protein
MMFTLITLLAAAGAILGLAFHRFWTTRAEARSNLLYAEVAKRFFAWLALRTIQMSRRASLAAWWSYLRALPLWRAPVPDRWLYLALYGSFLYLAGSGGFFAIFIPRGLFGFPLVGHVMAGGLFAVSVTILVLFKARNFITARRPAPLAWSILDPRRMGITAARVRVWAFWLFVAAGFMLTASALLPMLPLLRTPGQKLMFDVHRYSALVSVVAAAVFAGLEVFAANPAPKPPGLPQDPGE